MSNSLSILIASIQSRDAFLSELLHELNKQGGGFKEASFSEISGCRILIFKYTNHEVIIAIDNQAISTGAKRNILYSIASGKYSVSIDDDDMVPEYYTSVLLSFCKLDVDCFAINGYITTNGENKIDWFVSKDFNNITINRQGEKVYLRKSNHITPIRSELAKQVQFPDISNAEDKAFSDAINHLLITEAAIEPPMYHYRFTTANKTYK